VEGLPSGTVTFLFTDIEGSTPLWDAHHSAMRDALARHDQILRSAIDAGGGYVFATGGDGFCVAFQRAGSAVTAAMAAQRALLAESWPEHVELRVRMGLHSGEAEERDGNYFGPAVNRAARLMGAANGRQVVASAVTAGLVDADAGVLVHDLGAVRLKGLTELVHVVGLSAPDVPWLDAPLVARQTSAGNLPRPQTDLVGDLVDLQQRVATLADNRLVTLTGSGGVGKTRAAIEIGWLVLDEFPDGAWLIELAPIADPALIEPAIATGLGVQPQPDMTLVGSIVDWCTGRRVLLIIDNCEHVLDPATEVIDAIVKSCPTATVLATSREPLGIRGEYVVRIPSLAPAHSAELFRTRAAATGAELTGSDDEAAAIEAICARLDGIPLAIEIAASRTRSLTPNELLARLDDRFRLLRGGGRGIERHQTLRATVAWSYQLLTDQQQLLFDRVSVFAGGFDLPTAEAICSDDLLDGFDIIDLLGELVDKSMVIADRTGTTTRYRLLETLRQYGEERLTDRSETAMLRDRHLEHYANLARPVWKRYLTAEQVQIDLILTTEWDNLRTAHQWAITMRDRDVAAAIASAVHFYARNRLINEVSDWVDQTLALADEDGFDDVFIVMGAAHWAYTLADPDRAGYLSERAWSLAANRELDELESAAVRAVHLATSVGRGGDATAAVADAHRALEAAEDPASRVLILISLLDAHVDPAAVAVETEQLLEAARQTESPWAMAEATRLKGNQLLYHLTPPEHVSAMAWYREAASLAAEIDAPATEGWARGGLSAAAVLGGRPEGMELIQAALRFASELHHPQMTDAVLSQACFYLASRSDLPPAAMILGNLDKRESSIALEAVGRAHARATLSEIPSAEENFAIGAAMNRPEIVAYTQAALEAIGPNLDGQPLEFPR